MSDNVTWDWCWECNSYHRTEAGQPLNMRCNPKPDRYNPPPTRKLHSDPEPTPAQPTDPAADG